MITPNLSRKNKTPIYEQLYVYIKEEIINNTLNMGDQLPPKKRLSKHLNISVNTITKAYETLMDEGYIYSIERKGYFVSDIENLIYIDGDSKRSHKDYIKQKFKYDFKMNNNDIESFPVYTWGKLSNEIITDYSRKWLKHSNPQGMYGLRDSIRRYLKHSRDVDTDVENVVISSGIEYLFQILFYIIPKSKKYSIENPGYRMLRDLLMRNNIKFDPVDIDENGISIEGLNKNASEIVFVTPSHQFPTGIIMPMDRKVELLNWVNGDEGRIIIEDDYDSEFKYYGRPIPALKSLDTSDRVIYMGNFSKSISPGIRISYMVLPDYLLEKYHEILPFINSPVSTLNQMITSKFIEEGYFERHVNKMRGIYNGKRLILKNIFKQYDFCRVLDSKAGFHFIVEVDTDLSERYIVEEARKRSIYIEGLSSYYFNDGDRHYIKPRIVFGYGNIDQEDMEKGIAKFIEIILEGKEFKEG